MPFFISPSRFAGRHGLDIGVDPVGGGPGRAELPLHGGGVGLDHLPLECFGLASAANGDAVIAEETPERAASKPALFGELLEANPGLVALDEVIGVVKYDWSGHVFDFETETGLMFAGGITVHNCRCAVRALDAEDLKTQGIDLSSSEGKLSDVEVPTSRNPGAPTATVTRFEYAPRKFFAPDPGFNYNPGAATLKPFTPPPLDTLPRTFPQGVALPSLPVPTPVTRSRLLADDLPHQDYARAFLSAFGADIGKGVIFKDVAGASLAIDEALFQDGAGNWKAGKNGRGPFMSLLAEAVKSPDEIWLRREESHDRPGTYRLKRRYIKGCLVEGDNGPQYALSVFESGKDGWSGSTAMMGRPDRNEAARRRYIEQQRDGFLLYQK